MFHLSTFVNILHKNIIRLLLSMISFLKVCFNVNEGLPDGLSRAKDLTDSGDRMREYSGSRVGPPSVKSSRDEGDNLKAAIEAAVLKKPGVYRKHRAGQSDESSMPTVGGEIVSHQDHISSAIKKKPSSDVELPEKPSSLKEGTLNIMKQSSLAFYSKDMFSNVPAVMPLLLKSLAIPEHEHIWQYELNFI